MSQQARLLGYCLLVGTLGWGWLLSATAATTIVVGPLLLFVAVAGVVEALGFRIPPDDPHSLVGVVLLSATLALGPVEGALIAAVEGLLLGIGMPLYYGQPRTTVALIGRPLLRSGARAIALLGGSMIAARLVPASSDWLLLLILILSLVLVMTTSRVVREWLAGGASGLRTWWEASWRSSLLDELLPLPLAALGAAVYRELPWPYFVLVVAALVGGSLALQRNIFAVQRQRVNVRELALLNEASRAIIRAELNVTQLCELIYQQVSKVVDTSSFHLGLFDGDTYTLTVWIQDRVRKPPLTVNLPEGDGLVGWIRQTGRSLLVRDFLEEMERLPAKPRYQSDHPPRSGIYIPLIAGERVLGSISVQSYRPRAFNAEDLRILSLIADQAAVAIARAQAFAAAEQRANQLKAIREVSNAVAAILNLDQLLPAIVQLIRERFGYHPVHIFTVDPEVQTAVFRASSAANLPSHKLQRLQIKLGQGVVGYVAQQGEPLLAPDVRKEPRYLRDERATLSELAVPIKLGESVLGVLDVQSDKVDDFDETDRYVITTLADQIAVAIDSANLYTLEQEESWTLNSLLQVAENIARRNSLDDLQTTIVRLPPLLAGCDRCLLLRWQEDTRSFLPVASYGFDPEQRKLLQRSIPETDAPLLMTMRQAGQLVALEDAERQSDQLLPLTGELGSRALLALPLMARGNLLATLVIDHCREPHRFSRRQLGLYRGFANQAAAAIESALLALEAATASRLEQELRVAREIQTTLLPARPPTVAGYDLAADWRSARIVGGDFYDFWWLGTSLGFVIADVSDKGVAAALFMALSRSLVRAAALDGSPPYQALIRANRWIARDSESGMFVTLFYGILDTATGELAYTCAGHNPPLHYQAASGNFTPLSTPGIALGVLDEVSLGQATTVLQPGDMLVCYTDGVTEAINTDEEPFDVERLEAVIAANHQRGAQVVVEEVNAALQRFSGGLPSFDDVTMVAIRRLDGC